MRSRRTNVIHQPSDLRLGITCINSNTNSSDSFRKHVKNVSEPNENQPQKQNGICRVFFATVVYCINTSKPHQCDFMSSVFLDNSNAVRNRVEMFLF